jgi:hypothetical protein
MTKNRRNTLAGPAYENELIEIFKGSKIFPHLCRTAISCPERDKMKVDLMPVEKEEDKFFPYNIQAKSSTSAINYPKVINEMPNEFDKTNVVFHKKTKRVAENRFITEGHYAILRRQEFLDIMIDLRRYQIAYNELMCYWDSLPEDHQKELHQTLKNLSL